MVKCCFQFVEVLEWAAYFGACVRRCRQNYSYWEVAKVALSSFVRRFLTFQIFRTIASARLAVLWSLRHAPRRQCLKSHAKRIPPPYHRIDNCVACGATEGSRLCKSNSNSNPGLPPFHFAPSPGVSRCSPGGLGEPMVAGATQKNREPTSTDTGRFEGTSTPCRVWLLCALPLGTLFRKQSHSAM